MSPRRPVPARPGTRPGARPGARADRGTATPAGGTPRASRRPATTPPPRTRPPAQVTIGGPEGVAVSYRVVAVVLAAVFGFIIVFPALRMYLTQRARYDAAVEELAQARATSTALAQEVQKWEDDTYVRAQVRERLGYAMPGETTYVVVGAEDLAQAQERQAAERAQAEGTVPWYTALASSLQTASGVQEEVTDPARRGWQAPGSEWTPAPTGAPVLPTDTPTEETE